MSEELEYEPFFEPQPPEPQPAPLPPLAFEPAPRPVVAPGLLVLLAAGAALVLLTLACAAGVLLGRELAPAPTPLATAVPPTPLPVSAGANELEAEINAVYQRAGPSVVNITNRSVEYDFFMNPIPREGSGSGFFYDDRGHIVTNYHVVAGAQELRVTLADGRNLPADLVGADPTTDLAVLHVDVAPGETAVAPLGDSGALRVGQFVIAIGNPFGLEGTLTVGVVSSLGRVIESPDQNFISEVIQTDAPINPGNSGGPLLNLSGEVVGVNAQIVSTSGSSAGIGFAIPAHTVRRVADALIATGHYPHPTLGARFFTLTPERAGLLADNGIAVPRSGGLLIVEVTPGGPADRAGLRAGQRLVRMGGVIFPVGGDVITAIDGQAVAQEQDLLVYLETHTQIGQTVQVTVARDGRDMTVAVTLGEAGW